MRLKPVNCSRFTPPAGISCLLLAISTISAGAGEFTPEQIDFFESKIRPLFADHCYACHSATAEKIKGGLRLDTPEALLKGGTSGAAIVAGDAESSLLIKAVRYKDRDLQA